MSILPTSTKFPAIPLGPYVSPDGFDWAINIQYVFV